MPSSLIKMNHLRVTLSVVLGFLSLIVYAQESKTDMMKVEVWSDVVCPFCYIGKAHFDNAMEQFEGKEDIEFVWKSFQLDPTVQTNTQLNLYEHLSESKGVPLNQAKAMGEHAAQMGKTAGIEMNFNKAVVANSFDAHRLIHWAKENGKQQEMKSRLFKAYFTEGKNIDDQNTLISLAEEMGLDGQQAKTVLESDAYTNNVQNDVLESRQLGVRGVPFFVFNEKYAISGAQPENAFLKTLRSSYEEWKQSAPKPKLKVSEGPSCSPNEVCD